MTRSNGQQPKSNKPTVEPYSEEAERAVLGAIMLDSEIAWPLIDGMGIAERDFFLGKHRLIYRAACELRNDGQPVDNVTLLSALETKGQLADVGADYLAGLVHATPTAYHVEGHAEIVWRDSRRRALLRWADDMAQSAYATDFDYAGLVERLRVRLENLERDRDRREWRDPWQVYTLADAYTPRTPLQYIVSGLFALPSLSIVYGPPGTLKSFLLADMLACVAGGLPWLAALPGGDASPKHVLQYSVMWLDFDNGGRRTAERFEALGRAHGLPDTTPLFYVSMPSPWLDASNRDALGDLIDRIKSYGAMLVVIDNLGVVSGDAEENSGDMLRVMSNLRWVAEQSGAAIVLIHHQRKATGFAGRAGEGLRGHGSIEAALDLALLVEREERSSLVTVRSTKTRDVDVSPFGAQFTFEHKPGTHELAAARFFGVTVEDTNSDSAIERAVLEALEGHHPMNQTALVAKVKESVEAGIHRVRHVASRMVADGRLKATSGSRGAKDYDLP